MDKWKCCRCDYEWYGRDPNVRPNRCARCKAPYWWRPKRVKKPKPEPKPFVSKYGFETMQVGESKLVRWPDDPTFRESGLIKPAAVQCARRHGWTFSISPLSSGLLVKRIA